MQGPRVSAFALVLLEAPVLREPGAGSPSPPGGQSEHCPTAQATSTASPRRSGDSGAATGLHQPPGSVYALTSVSHSVSVSLFLGILCCRFKFQSRHLRDKILKEIFVIGYYSSDLRYLRIISKLHQWKRVCTRPGRRGSQLRGPGRKGVWAATPGVLCSAVTGTDSSPGHMLFSGASTLYVFLAEVPGHPTVTRLA